MCGVVEVMRAMSGNEEILIERAVVLLKSIQEDTTVPKNLRMQSEEAIAVLCDKQKEPNLRVGRVTEILESMCRDSNLSTYTRTQIWNVLSIISSL